MLIELLKTIFLLLLLLKTRAACTTHVPNSTTTNSSLTNITATKPPACETAYPSELRILNSRHPDFPVAPGRFFMLLRQGDATAFQIATQVQFHDLPPANANSSSTCRLDFALPGPDMANIRGPLPVFDVYLVEREPGEDASWSTYEGARSGAVSVGGVDGRDWKLQETRRNGGVLSVTAIECNRTLTFQMGFRDPGVGVVDYWDFVDVAPPATPVQGWRVVHGC